MVLEALEAGKNVLVEKPLALREDDLGAIESFYAARGGEPRAPVDDGFNRRFSPAMSRAKKCWSATLAPIDRQLSNERGLHSSRSLGIRPGRRRTQYRRGVPYIRCICFPDRRHAGAYQGTSASAQRAGNGAPGRQFRCDHRLRDGSLCSLTYTALGSQGLSQRAHGDFLRRHRHRTLTIIALSRFQRAQRRRMDIRQSPRRANFRNSGALPRGFASPAATWPISLADQTRWIAVV